MNSSTFNFKRLPWACISAILVVIILQYAFASYPGLQNALFVFSQPSRSDPFRIRYLLNQAKKDEGKKVMLVGTSQSREGFDVSVLNERFKDDNITFYNLGSAAYSGVDLYMEIDRILDAKSDLIVYMPYVGNFYLDYDFKRLKYYYHPKIIPFFLDKIGHKPFLENRWFFFDAYMSNVFYFYKYRKEIKASLFNCLDYLIFHIGKKPEAKYFSYDENFPLEYFEDQVKEYKGKKFYFSNYTEAEQDAFHKTIQAIKKSRTSFLVIDAPVNPRITSVYAPGVGISYETFLMQMLHNEGIPFVGRKELPDFGADNFIDFTHLNSVGRAKLTSFFADYFKTKYLPRLTHNRGKQAVTKEAKS
jgi:hypothetical protein